MYITVLTHCHLLGTSRGTWGISPSIIPSFPWPGNILKIVWSCLLKLYQFVSSVEGKVGIAFKFGASTNMAVVAILNFQLRNLVRIITWEMVWTFLLKLEHLFENGKEVLIAFQIHATTHMYMTAATILNFQLSYFIQTRSLLMYFKKFERSTTEYIL